jgi:hypothetical protein
MSINMSNNDGISSNSRKQTAGKCTAHWDNCLTEIGIVSTQSAFGTIKYFMCM